MQKRIMIVWAAAFCLLQPVPAMAEGETEKTVTVSASESVTAVPDKASVELEIITEGQDSQAVQQENSEKTEDVKKTLEALGVMETDIRTAYFNISPKYDYSSDDMRIIGYLATNRIEVSGQDLSQIGTLIAAANESGANSTGSLEFYCSNYNDLYLEALETAVKTAETKALTLAHAAGYGSVSAISISEGYQDSSMRYLLKNYMGAATNDAIA